MANEDRQSEQFIREVDEELRRAQMKSIWDRFAPLIIGACVLVVLLTAGYRGFLWWETRQAAEDGDRFMAALEQIETGDREAGEIALQAIAAEGDGGYAVLAQMRLAGAQVAAGETAEAIAAYDAVAANDNATTSIRDVARLRAALLALDSGDLDGATERAQPLEEPGNPWRHAAREILGTADYQRGQLEAARDTFLEVQQDAETPGDLWMRAGMMVQLIDGQLAAPGTLAPQSDAADESAPEAGAAAPVEAPPAAAAPALDSPVLELPASELPAVDFTAPETVAPDAAAPEVPAADLPVGDVPAVSEPVEEASPAVPEPALPDSAAPAAAIPPVPPPASAPAEISAPPAADVPAAEAPAAEQTAPPAAPDAPDQPAADPLPASPDAGPEPAPQTVIPPQ